MMRSSALVLFIASGLLWCRPAAEPPATPRPCEQAVKASAGIRVWMTHFFGRPVQLVETASRAFDLSPYGTVESASGGEGTPNAGGQWILVPKLPFLITERKGRGVTVEAGDPDSFVDVIRTRTKAIYRVVQLGTQGQVLNAFWLDGDRFAAVRVLFDNDPAPPGKTDVECYDLDGRSAAVFAPATPHSVTEQQIYSYVRKTFGREHGRAPNKRSPTAAAH